MPRRLAGALATMRISRRDLHLYRRLLREARPYLTHVGGIFLLGVVSTGLVLLVPLPLKVAVDSVIGGHAVPSLLGRVLPPFVLHSDMLLLGALAALFILIAAVQQLQEFANLVLTTYTGEKLLLRFRSRILSHAERLSIAYHDSTGASDSAYRIQYDARVIRDVAIDGLVPLVTSAITVAGMIYVTARIDWLLAAIAVTVAPILFAILKRSRGHLRRQWRDTKRLESSALAVVEEVLASLRVVKAYGQEDRERDRFASLSGQSIRARLGASLAEGALGATVGLIFAMATAAILFIGAHRVRSGAITLGDFLLVLGYISQLHAPLKTMSKKYADLQSSLASGERVFSLLDHPREVLERPHAQRLSRTMGLIELRDVYFEYENGHPILQGVSLEIASGTRLGVVGTTGVGKTTLMSLLTRFHDPTAGEILLDGTDLRDLRLGDLRAQFALVLQDPVLFSTSIFENIAYARPECSARDVVEASRLANAHEFISDLPHGYLTEVGARGMRLSGGERQRIALARAFLKDAPILLLDEPTSAVDVDTEADILEAIDVLAEGRTTVLISHRPSTHALCDFLVELRRGRITSRKDVRSWGPASVRRAERPMQPNRAARGSH